MAVKKSKRDELVEVAQKLFYQHGFRITGIDTILEHSGVAKRTLYNHFKSKDELVVAALNKRDLEFMAMIKKYVAKFEKQQEGDPKYARILAYFDALSEWFNSDKFNGCMFINASAEYPRKTDPIHVVCENHKRLVLQYISELISEIKLREPDEVALQLSLLSDGAIVCAHTTNMLNAAEIAKTTAMLVLNAYRT
ncbi:TetR/AcrR family transcriptional regulator [Bowmanella sp. Y26]|uniref:TetR/AcrR family transcriptional regulator n=1 Tax=Bowmanella yangjiangensis TaxID=2811230 RepID=A0ABS3CRS1_9ALTE|nr:TetR/AcrR family transcriptional regulator [Bowmanella yangjiangensis]MBN7819817.1 TetR/AcrR family transcriptional regulator [Bowmanella yangjiangensis]MBT1063339.1 TetR/AcrR family transcriptional regulator [Bowmanella yangjiangensis]